MPFDGFAFTAEVFAKAVRPLPPLMVSEWADQHRRLSSKAASEPGPWRTQRIPFLREIMDVLSVHHPAKEVVFIKSTQVGGTEVGLNWLGYIIDHEPAPALAVLPTVEVGQRWSKQRLASMIEESPALRRKIAPAASRDGGNTASMKDFPGGVLMIGGANSAASLSSMPIRYLLLDEVDRYPIEVEEDGDPVDLAEARTSTFPRRKIFKISSPTIESLSRIWKDWKTSDQRRYNVPCPHCGAMQALKWDNLVWPENEPDKAAYRCEECAVLIEEHHKTAMLEAGRWIPTFPERETVGFHISGLYTPIGLGKRWADHAARWVVVKNDPVRAKVFVNTVLGECWADADEKLDWEEIRGRAEPYKLREIPPGCVILTAGVDVQKDRFEIIVRGYGRGGRRWTIDWHYLPADPSREEEWHKLALHLEQPFTNKFGVSMRLAAAGIDSGYLTDMVYAFTRRYGRSHNWHAIKGNGQVGRQILGRPSKVDFKGRGTLIKSGAEFYLVGVTTAKQQLYARLASDRKHDQFSRLERFSADLPEDFYQQLTAEVFDPNKRHYVKLKDRRNEALDTTVYADAIANHPVVRVQAMREPQWTAFERMLQPEGDLFSAANVEAAVPHETKPPPPDQPAQNKSGQDWLPRRDNWLRK